MSRKNRPLGRRERGGEGSQKGGGKAVAVDCTAEEFGQDTTERSTPRKYAWSDTKGGHFIR